MIISGHRVVLQCEDCGETSRDVWRDNEAACLSEHARKGWLFDLADQFARKAWCSEICREVNEKELHLSLAEQVDSINEATAKSRK